MKNFFFAILLMSVVSAVIKAQTAETAALLKRGDALVAQANYKAAIDEYAKVSSRAGDLYARALYNIGVCQYELWRTQDAIEFYRRAIAEVKEGNYPLAWYALGVALEDEGRSSEARTAYEQSLHASHRKFGAAVYRLGVIEAKAGDFAKAATLFREAAAREGAHVAASRNNLGVMLVRLGFIKEAEEQFEIAVKATHGRYGDATHNLNLCRSLNTTARRDHTIYKVSLN